VAMEVVGHGGIIARTARCVQQRGSGSRQVGTLPAYSFRAPGMAASGDAAGDWNRAGLAHPGEARGRTSGDVRPLFLPAICRERAGWRPDRRRPPAGAEQGGSGLPRRVPTWMTQKTSESDAPGQSRLACDQPGRGARALGRFFLDAAAAHGTATAFGPDAAHPRL
jgi:hypothetical protein